MVLGIFLIIVAEMLKQNNLTDFKMCVVSSEDTTHPHEGKSCKVSKFFWLQKNAMKSESSLRNKNGENTINNYKVNEEVLRSTYSQHFVYEFRAHRALVKYLRDKIPTYSNIIKLSKYLL